MEKSKILNFIQNSPSPVTKKEVARAFDLKGSGSRVELKKILKQLEEEGAISKNPGGAYGTPEGLPNVGIVEVIDVTVDGEVYARLVEWNTDTRGPAPKIEIMPDKKGHPVISPGDRALVKLVRQEDGDYEAHVLRRMDTPRGRVMGSVRFTKHGAVLQPADKKAKFDYEIPERDLNGAKDGDLAVGEIQPSRGMKDKKVRIVEIIGKRNDPKSFSLISLYESGIQPQFPKDVIAESEGLKVPPLENREDLRGVPLITIDGIDARDFDDAVYAQKTDDGFHLIVAIADVAYYVRPFTSLDTEAQRRGNSTYFPDRVVPMLPEALSNDLCSLRPHEPRACLAVHMWIDNEGRLLKYKFVRGLMKSAARTTYEQIQAAMEGILDDVTKPLIKDVIKPLYDAFAVLDAARRKRGALELDIPERKVILDEQGNMKGVIPRARLDSHKLIEEFMVLANVAAASALEDKKSPCVYRIHDKPSPDKLDSVREFIESFGLSLPKGQVINPAQLNYILIQAAKMPYSHLISTVMLRSQSQANYAPKNIGHFGLALTKYAHFTSPIRRYADLLVHRSLISAYRLGPGGIDDGEIARLAEICDHISNTERTSMQAERSAIDRFTAAFLSDQIGGVFDGRITGVTRFGLFVELSESGADGIVPMRSLPNDFYIHDERAHALIGRRSGRVFRLGAPVTVKLREADGITGSTVLELLDADRGAEIPGVAFKRSNRGFDRRERGGGRKGPKDKKNFKKKRR